MPLSDLACRTAKPRQKAYKLFDGEGLYLEIRPNGNRYWRLKYHILGTEKRISLGKYPTTSLSEAREEKIKAKKSIQNLIDPSAEKQENIRLAGLNVKTGKTDPSSPFQIDPLQTPFNNGSFQA